MKKNVVYIFIMSALVTAMVSCEEGEPSKLHEWTEEEIIFRDSLEAAKNNIQANYVITYDVTLPLDTVNYRSVEVEVETATVLEKLGFSSEEELTTALGTVTSGVQYDHTVSFFAINNSTRYDYTGSFTANGLGYWFDSNGDVCSWGDTDAVFSEFNSETFVFSVGQHPTHVETGDQFKLIQVMEKDDYRLAFVINVTVGEYYQEEVPQATNVKTVDLTLEATPNNEYATTDLAFSFAEAAAAIGVSESELSANLTFYGISSDESMTSTYTSDAGYWYNNLGDVADWGTEGCTLYVNYEDGIFHIGQYPDACQAGEEFSFSVAIMYKTTKTVTYNITLKIIE